MKEKYTRTDLACESLPMNRAADSNDCGIDYSENEISGIRVCRLDIKSKAGEIESGKPIGTYITVFCGKIWEYGEEEFDLAAEVISSQIRTLASEMCERNSLPECVLIAGLGNREITADALGPKTADSVTVTRHVRADAELFKILGGCDISAISPGVLGQTGIETLELIRGAAENVTPDVVIAVDALAARSCERLCNTVQLASTGICPGSGIGNKRKAINHGTVGIPVMSLGVPTVVDSSSLVYDALQQAGIEQTDTRLAEILENRRSFFVTPKESDVIIDELSRLLSSSLDLAFRR